MKKTILFCFLTLSALFAQDKIQTDFDYAVFHYDDTSSVIELYYSFIKESMNLINENDTTLISGILKIDAVNKKNNNKAISRKWNFEFPVDTSKDKESFTGVLRFQIDPGDYKLTVAGIDATKPKISNEVEFDVKVREFPADSISVSDIQLASAINTLNPNQTSIFYKNSMEIVPHPALVFGNGNPVVFFYYEMYNIDKNISSELLKVEHYLINNRDEQIYNKVKYFPRKQGQVADAGAIPINKLPSGVYKMAVSVSDTISGRSVFSMRKLYIVNPGIFDEFAQAAEDPDLLSSELAGYNEEELDNFFSISKYIATQNEIDEWKKINTVDGKRQFLFDFWESRDESPETEKNEFKNEYLERVKIANREFADLLHKKGYTSDRGRVFVKYGRPSEIERYPNEADLLPHEIWIYENIESGVEFVFADFTGYSDYRLIHSTKRGEFYNSNWHNEIRN